MSCRAAAVAAAVCQPTVRCAASATLICRHADFDASLTYATRYYAAPVAAAADAIDAAMLLIRRRFATIAWL